MKKRRIRRRHSERMRAIKSVVRAVNAIAEGRREKPTVTWDSLRRGADRAAKMKGEWAGTPLPVHHHALVLEPRYPFPDLNGAMLTETSIVNVNKQRECSNADVDESGGVEVVNEWYCFKIHTKVVVVRYEGRLRALRFPMNELGSKVNMLISTMGVASQAWDADAEDRAVHTLGTLIAEHLHRAYRMTGTFIETSKRSGVTYVFRRCRPTIALTRSRDSDNLRVLAVLCLHPIGYYAGTWAGAMVPTDDVIAHLLMMRGDERKFWSKCNKHNIDAPEAGL